MLFGCPLLLFFFSSCNRVLSIELLESEESSDDNGTESKVLYVLEISPCLLFSL